MPVSASPVAPPWMWGRHIDLAVFGGSAAVALVVSAASSYLAPDGGVPAWAWLLFVLGLDVAHVWTTIFRTYLDGEVLRKRWALLLGLPVACYALGVALHYHGALTFWRVLAYAAVFHFIRQQVGWVAIYRARAQERSPLDRYLDEAVVYFATMWPLLYWHAHLPRDFQWFVPNDFVHAPWMRQLVVPLAWVYLALLLTYAGRSIWHWRRGHVVNTGKHVVVATTAVIWFVGIVAVNDDFTFTVTNVTVHAVPYMALLWAYCRERAKERPQALVARVVRGGLVAFFTVVLALAFCEELLWDRLVWHERSVWFGGAESEPPLLSEFARALVVPLLALPQAVHYALDGFVWRRKDTGRAQAMALGFAASPVERRLVVSG